MCVHIMYCHKYSKKPVKTNRKHGLKYQAAVISRPSCVALKFFNSSIWLPIFTFSLLLKCLCVSVVRKRVRDVHDFSCLQLKAL